jgi:inositol transport system permease protein
MILQVSIIGLLAIGVTQVIITTGIDLSSGSVLALSAMIAASLAQSSDYTRAVFPSLTDLPVWAPVIAGLGVGLLAGAINGSIIAITGIPPFIATLGMMVSARGLARYYTGGQPVSMLNDSYTAIGQGAMPVIIFLVIAVIFHIALRYTKYGKYTYAIGGNMQAARTSGINVKRHLVIVYRLGWRAWWPRRGRRPGRQGWGFPTSWTPSPPPSLAAPAWRAVSAASPGRSSVR